MGPSQGERACFRESEYILIEGHRIHQLGNAANSTYIFRTPEAYSSSLRRFHWWIFDFFFKILSAYSDENFYLRICRRRIELLDDLPR